LHYTGSFANQIRELDLMVIMQKEMDLYNHRKKMIRKMITLYYNDPLKHRHYERQYRDVSKHMNLLARQMTFNQDIINNPRLLISRYMELYQVSIKSVANLLHISPHTITNYLSSNHITLETRTFIYWAIRNFRLDANLYWVLLESLNKKDAM